MQKKILKLHKNKDDKIMNFTYKA